MASEDALIARVLPHNSDAEKAVVGSMLMDDEALSQGLEMLSSSDFYLRQYGVVFEAMAELFAAGSPVDPVTLAEKLRKLPLSNTGSVVSNVIFSGTSIITEEASEPNLEASFCSASPLFSRSSSAI